MTIEASSNSTRKTTEDRPVEQGKMGWVSPNYSVSRSVTLTPETLLENRCIAINGLAPEIESYKVLRAQIISHAQKNGGNTLMVTSALPGEGKTLTSINLALTFAKEFSQTALLVDCDLRQQKIHELLGYNVSKGLGDYLTNNESLENIIVWPGVEKLTVISGGQTVGGSSELLGSPGMKTLVQEMKSRYPERFIIFDVPSVLSSADALAFAPLVDFIVVVVRADGQTPAKDVQKSLQMLPQEKIIGLILNRKKE
jgi:non-specific protein-tyrosine kinase